MNNQSQFATFFRWYTNLSLRKQLILLMFPLMLGATLIVLFVGQRLITAQEETAIKHLNAEANYLKEAVNAPFANLPDDLAFLKTGTAAYNYAFLLYQPSVSEAEEFSRQAQLNQALSRLNSDLRVFMQGHPLYTQIRLVNPNGVELIRLQRNGKAIELSASGDDLSRNRIFRSGLALRTPRHISASEISFQENADGSQHPIIQIITPLGVSLDSLQIAGYFIFDLDLTDSFSALSQYQNDDAIAYLVDQEGLYWAAASPEQGLVLRSSEGLTGLRDAETKTVLAGELQSRIDLNHAGEEYLGVTERIYPLSAFPETRQIPAWTLLLAQPHDSIHGAISSLRFLAVVIFLGLFLLTALFIWLHSGYLLKEIGTFQRAFQRVSHGDLSTQLRLESSNEFNHAADDFNEMTDHVRDLVVELEARVQARIRDLDVVAQISSEVAGLRDLELVLNRAINRIVERFEYYHAQVFLCDELHEYAMLVASTNEPGQRLLAKKHKLAIGSDSVIGRVTALGITVIAGDTTSSDVPWQPNIELPDTRSEMALPLKVESKVIGALDIQSLRPEAFSPNEIEIFQVLADQLAVAIDNTRLINLLENRVSEVGTLNQRLTEKVWADFTEKAPNDPIAYHYNLLNVEPLALKDTNNGAADVELPSYSTAIKIAGNQIGEIKALLPTPLTGDEESLIEAVASRVALALDNARLVQETQVALSESQRLFEIARAVNSATELDIYGIYKLINEHLVFEDSLDHIAVLLAEPIPSYHANHLVVGHLWGRAGSNFAWKPQQRLDLTQRGLTTLFEPSPRQPILIRHHNDTQTPILHEIAGALNAETLLVIPLASGTRWFGVLICGSASANAFTESYLNYTYAVADQLTIAIDNRRLIAEVEDEARRALALAEAGQLVSQMGADLESGTERLFKAVSGPGEFDRWWFGLLEPNGYELRCISAATATSSAPLSINLQTERNTITETIALRQMTVVNDFSQEHPLLGEISRQERQRYGKHLAVPVLVGGEDLLGALLIGRDENLRDFDDRDIQLATTLASQLAVATENRQLFSQSESQRQTLQTTLEAMPAGVLVLSLQGHTILSNQQAVELLGAGVNTGLFADSTYPLYQTGTDERYTQVDFTASLIASRRLRIENLYILRPNGQRSDLLLNAAAITNEQGKIASAVLVLQEITELRELEAALQSSLNETTALYEASRALATVSTPSDLVDAMVEQLQTLEPTAIYVLLQEGQDVGNPHTRIAAAWPESEQAITRAEDIPVPYNALMPLSAVVLQGDVPTDSGLDAQLLTQIANAGIQSLASLPLRVRGDRILGWFTVVFRGSRRRLSSEEQRLLMTLADQASVALDAQRLYESTQQALRAVANLYRGSKRISESQGILQAVPTIQDELMRFQPDRIDLLLQQNPESPELLGAAISWAEERSLQDIPCLPIHPETLELQAEFDLGSREQYFIQDMQDPETQSDLHDALRDLDTPYNAVLSIPLRAAGRTVGRLALGFLKARHFSPDDRQFVTMLADSTAYIVENEILFQQTQNSLEETGVLYQASRAIANSQQREDVVQAMMDYAASALVDRVMLITLLSRSWDDPSGVVEVSATWGRGDFLDLKGLHFSREQLPIWPHISSPEILWSDDVSTDFAIPEEVRLGYDSLEIRSFVIVPLQTPNRPIGAILLASAEPRTHQDREIRIYQSLADQAATQLENKRLFEQAELRARQLATSAEVSRTAISTLNLDQLFPLTINLIRDAFGYDHAQIFMVDDEGKYAVLRAATGEAGAAMLKSNHAIAVNTSSVVGQATALGQPFLVNDTTASNVMHRPNPFLPHTRAELAVPLLLKGSIVGALDVQSNQPGAFGDDDIQVLMTLAEQLAIAIDNAQLFNISQKRAAEMTFLFDITSSAASASNLLETLENVSIMLIRQMRGKESIIFLYNAEKNRLEATVVVLAYQTNHGLEYRFLEREIELDLGQSLVGWVGEHRQALIVPDLQKDQRYLGSVSTTHSGIYVPLLFGETLVGVLSIEGDRVDQFGQDDLQMLQALSSSLTAVLQNLQLVTELQATNERLREIDQLKTNFLAAMSHELRTPLNSIIGFSRVILKGIDGPINEMQQQDIQTIHDSGRHLLGLVNDILDQAKIEAGKMELAKEYFDLEGVIKGVMSSAKGLNKDKPIQLFTEIQPNLPNAFGDESRTRQILFNLVSNASKFTHEGSITLNAHVASEKADGRAMIVVSVTDTGIGIAEKDRRRIFESFQQVDNTTTRSAEGTGLGLPLARSLVELQGGKIWVESQEEIGSTFHVTIPMEPEPEPETLKEAPILVAQDPNPTGPRPPLALRKNTDSPTLPVRPGERKVVLVVDDEVGMIDLYRRFLSKEGWHVIGETDPKMVEERVVAHRPKLILLDINMPNRNGWEVLERLKNWDESSQIPVIVCSIDNDTGQSSTLGAAKHLVKPFVENDLVEAVRNLPLS